MVDCVKVFKSLSDTTRLRILRLLFAAGKDLCICEITGILALPQYHVSRHMKELKNAGLVAERRAGRYIYYGLVDQVDLFSKQIIACVAAAHSGQCAVDDGRLKKWMAQALMVQCADIKASRTDRYNEKRRGGRNG